MRSSFKPLAGFLFATDFVSISTLLLAFCCSKAAAAASAQKSGPEEAESAGRQHFGYGEAGVGMSAGGSDGRATERVMGREATMGEERREWRRASRAKETEMAGARVMEPQGEGGRDAMKVAEEEVRGEMDERGRGTCGKCYGFVFADVMRCGACIGVAQKQNLAGMWRQGAHFE